MLRADAAYRKGEYAAAQPMLDALWKLPEREREPAPRQAAILFRRAHCRFELGNHAGAAKLFLQLAKDFSKEELAPKALWLAAQSALAEKKTAEAYQAYQQLLETYPAYGERARMMKDAALLAGSLKNTADMIRWLTAFLGETPEPPDAAEAHYWLALARQDAGDNPAAAEEWERARTLDGGRYYQPATQQLIRLALLAENLETLQKEVAGYDRWRETHTYADAVPLEVYEWLGQELAQRGKAGAETFLRRVLAASEEGTQRYRVHLRLCRLLSAQNNPGAAVREWKTFRVNFPQYADQVEVMESQARALLESGEYDEAERMAEELLRRYPEGLETRAGDPDGGSGLGKAAL
ncbi:MAG: tetratricopeptide repeat protein [Bdellovibrionaceae bacterium]|nr:tetratricopeptide repeat protein [Pseudobdellovibrionaceae bacterium]